METMLSIGIGALAGLHVATWGMYKDAPHEGFTRGKFLRSLTLSSLLGPVAAAVLGLTPVSAASALLLFGVVYAFERALTEAWKTFFRKEDQAKYTIPMQAAILGHPIRSRWLRCVIGVVYLGLIAGGVIAVAAIHTPPGASPLFLALTVGALGGWFSAFGGAWKDAPIEGFQFLKFFRSPAFAASFAWGLFVLGGTPSQVVLAAIGFTVATIETWKTFRSHSSPPGKFAGKPVHFPEMLRLRTRAVPAYLAIWILVLAGFLAELERRRRRNGPCQRASRPHAWEPDACDHGRSWLAAHTCHAGDANRRGRHWRNSHRRGRKPTRRAGGRYMEVRGARVRRFLLALALGLASCRELPTVPAFSPPVEGRYVYASQYPTPDSALRVVEKYGGTLDLEGIPRTWSIVLRASTELQKQSRFVTITNCGGGLSPVAGQPVFRVAPGVDAYFLTISNCLLLGAVDWSNVHHSTLSGVWMPTGGLVLTGAAYYNRFVNLYAGGACLTATATGGVSNGPNHNQLVGGRCQGTVVIGAGVQDWDIDGTAFEGCTGPCLVIAGTRIRVGFNRFECAGPVGIDLLEGSDGWIVPQYWSSCAVRIRFGGANPAAWSISPQPGQQ